jgi:hypothetical protein
MTVKKASAIVVERMPSVRKAKASVAKHPDRRQETRELLDQIKVRGDQLSAEIKELLVRMS